MNLALDVQPRPDRIELHSRVGDFTNTAGAFGMLPAARYEGWLYYGEIKDVQTMPIRLLDNLTFGAPSIARHALEMRVFQPSNARRSRFCQPTG